MLFLFYSKIIELLFYKPSQVFSASSLLIPKQFEDGISKFKFYYLLSFYTKHFIKTLHILLKTARHHLAIKHTYFWFIPKSTISSDKIRHTNINGHFQLLPEKCAVFPSTKCYDSIVFTSIYEIKIHTFWNEANFNIGNRSLWFFRLLVF